MTSTNCLFEAFNSDKLSLANRLVMAPMTRSFSPHNVPSDQVVEYYRRRAAGGLGLIITEGTTINHIAAHGYPNVPNFHGEQALEAWRKVANAVHAEGGKIAPQLWHVGAARRPGTEPGGQTPGFSPSGMFMPGKITGHAMTKDDIDEVVQAYAQAAKDAQQAGFDAIEIHAAHGYLIDQFFWAGTNQREDEYGGDMAARGRFAQEIVSAIRAAVGPDFAIILRWSQWKQQAYDARLVETPEALAEFIQPLADAGVDIFHCSTRRFWQPEFESSNLNLAGWVKKLTGKATITVGSVGLSDEFLPESANAGFKEASPVNFDELVERMENNEFDLVALGRSVIANPDWPKLVQAGKFDQLKPYEKRYLESLV
ncbi:NADH:flavin oxidoreductase [Halioxenophilus aromaticivorans]